MSVDDAQWLWKKYWEERWSLAKIASEAGVSVGTVYNRMRRFGFHRRNSGRTHGDVSQAVLTMSDILEIKDRAETETYSSLAEEFGVSKQRIQQIVAGQHRSIRPKR